MRRLLSCALVALVLASSAALAGGGQNIANPAIDTAAFLRDTAAAMQYRESRRVTEAEFIRLSRLPGTVVLDARSKPKYDALHVRGAVNLSFTEFTAENLARMVPDANTLVLIYCNNNFANAPDPMPTKAIAAALNLSTYTSLYTYGYRNVYELGPFLDVNTTRIQFAGAQR